MKLPNESMRGMRMGSGTILLRFAMSLAFLFMLQPGLVASSGRKGTQ